MTLKSDQNNNTLENITITPEQVQFWDKEHIIHPWSDLSDSPPDMTQIQKAKGIYLEDGHGNKMIDGPGGMWCVNIGYGRREMADAIANQIMTMTYSSPWFTSNQPSALLGKRIAEKTPGDLNSMVFTNGGSDAVDTALRFVMYRNNILGRPEKKQILCREKGYHGSSFLAASVSGTGREHDRRFMDTHEDIVQMLPNINPYLRPEGMSAEDWCDAKVKDMEDRILSVGADKIGAFIAEPILSSGGVIIPPPGYHKRTRELCRQYDIVYISDEVVTAFGRLGHWFASESVFGIIPDIITCAKGLTSGYVPMGAAIISDALMKDFDKPEGAARPFTNGYTYSGHPVAATAALTNMDILEREGILAHVQDVAPHFQQRLRDIGDKYDIIGDARGEGLLGCLEGVAASGVSEEKKLQIDSNFGYMMDEACEKRGLLVRPIINMCVFSPPLIITRDEIDAMFNILEEAVIEVQDKLKS